MSLRVPIEARNLQELTLPKLITSSLWLSAKETTLISNSDLHNKAKPTPNLFLRQQTFDQKQNYAKETLA